MPKSRQPTLADFAEAEHCVLEDLTVEMTGISKAKVHQLLREGRLDGRRLDGIILVTRASLERLLDSAEPYR